MNAGLDLRFGMIHVPARNFRQALISTSLTFGLALSTPDPHFCSYSLAQLSDYSIELIRPPHRRNVFHNTPQAY